MYFPLLKAPNCTGITTLSNFPPNNWELKNNQKQGKYVHLTYSNGTSWVSKFLFSMDSSFSTIDYLDYKDIIPDNSIALLSISDTMLPELSNQLLGLVNSKTTSYPSWRGELGLLSKYDKTSYMGEAFPFPESGTLLSFAPFLQFGKNVRNYALLMNVEDNAAHREGAVDIFDANDKIILKTQCVTNNQINIVSLDDLGFTQEDLPIISSKDMAFIPIYFSISGNAKHMSLEHSHPPSNMAVLGRRYKVQQFLKERWLSHIKD